VAGITFSPRLDREGLITAARRIMNPCLMERTRRDQDTNDNVSEQPGKA